MFIAVYTSAMTEGYDDSFVGEEERKRRRLMKKRAGMLKPVLRSDAIKQLDPFVTYTDERISQFTVYGMVSWTKDWAQMCGRYPDSICVTYQDKVMTVREMVDDFRMDMFSSSKAALFSLHYRKDDMPVMITRTKISEKEPLVKVKYYFSFKGPRYTDVRRLSHNDDCEGFITIVDEGKEEHYSYREGCNEEVSDSTASQLLGMYYSAMWKKPAFKVEEYYDSPSYGMWTMNAHITQMRVVLKNVPENVLIVAPGDGLGMIARLRSNVIAGDMAITPMTDMKVVKETITSTILRGLERECRKVFVLSYISEFMKQSDWEMIADQSVIVIDSYHVVKKEMNGELQMVGPGVITYGVPGVVSDVWEFRKKRVEVNYTENLLTSEGFDLSSDSPATNYLLTLAPGKKYYPMNERMKEYLKCYGVVPAENPTGTVLVNRLEELVKIGKGFFSPIGREVKEIPVVDVSSQQILPYRTVMRTDIMHRNIFNNLPMITSKEIDGFIYFFVPYEGTRSYDYDLVERKTMIKGQVRFGDVVLPRMAAFKEGRKITVYLGAEVHVFGLNAKGYMNTDELDRFQEPVIEVVDLFKPYIPMHEKQAWELYVGRRGAWTEFKRKVNEFNYDIAHMDRGGQPKGKRKKR